MSKYLDYNGTSKIVKKISTLQNKLQQSGAISPDSTESVELGSLSVGDKFYLYHVNELVEYVVVQKNNDSMFYFGDYKAVYVTPTNWLYISIPFIQRYYISTNNEISYSYPDTNTNEHLLYYVCALDESVRKRMRVITIPYETIETFTDPEDNKTKTRYVVKHGMDTGFRCYAFAPSVYELGLSDSYLTEVPDGRTFELFKSYPEFRKIPEYLSSSTTGYCTRSPAYRDPVTSGVQEQYGCLCRTGEITREYAIKNRSKNISLYIRPFICLDECCPVKVATD